MRRTFVLALLVLVGCFSWVTPARPSSVEMSNQDPGGGGLWEYGPLINYQLCANAFTYIYCYDPFCYYPTQPLLYACRVHV